MKNPEGQLTIKAKWNLLKNSTDLIFVLYNGTTGGGVENPRLELPERYRSQASPETLDKLTRNGLIETDGNRWYLADILMDFLESLSGTNGEANVKTIIGNRESLEKNVSYYFQAKQEGTETEKHLNKIRRNLRTILSNIRRTLSAIDFSIRDTYVTEPNIFIKTAILKENLNKLQELETAIRGNPTKEQYDGLLPYIETAFGETDEQLNALSIRFRTELGRFYASKKAKISIRLREYLDKIEQIDLPARKIEQIFHLWSNNQLELFSNINELLANDKAPVVKPRDLELSLDLDLAGDDNKCLEAIARTINIDTGTPKRAKRGAKRSELGRKAPPASICNIIDEVTRAFNDYKKTAGDQLLAPFILSYGGFLKEYSFEERIALFLETANQFHDKLVTDNQYSVFETNDAIYKCKNIKLKP